MPATLDEDDTEDYVNDDLDNNNKYKQSNDDNNKNDDDDDNNVDYGDHSGCDDDDDDQDILMKLISHCHDLLGHKVKLFFLVGNQRSCPTKFTHLSSQGKYSCF